MDPAWKRRESWRVSDCLWEHPKGVGVEEGVEGDWVEEPQAHPHRREPSRPNPGWERLPEARRRHQRVADEGLEMLEVLDAPQARRRPAGTIVDDHHLEFAVVETDVVVLIEFVGP